MSWKLQTHTRAVVQKTIGITGLFIFAVLGASLLQSSSLQVYAQDAKPKDAKECEAWGGKPKEILADPITNTYIYSSCEGDWKVPEEVQEAQDQESSDANKEEAANIKNQWQNNKQDICNALETDNCEEVMDKAIEKCTADGSVNADTDRDKILDCISQESGIDKEKLDETFENEENDETCKVSYGVGWIICPLSNFLASVADGVFWALESLLTYETTANAESREALQKQWAVMRNIANIAFVIGFLVVIYSQITGMGITAYGIKRLLPRIIVAAILVNLSFWICILAVDISNIVGAQLKDLLVGAIPTPEGGADTTNWQDVVGLALVGTAGAAAVAVSGTALSMLAMALPLLLSALFAVLVVIFILLARQAIITILIIIAPLAFVAYLLPNTNRWFGRWSSVFMSMLMLYPIIALVFGGSQFAAAVVRLGSEGSVQDYFIDLFSLAIQAIPLFIIPTLLRSAGGVLGKIGLVTNDKTKGLFDRSNKRGQDAIKRRQLNLAARSESRRAAAARGDKSAYKGKIGKARRLYDKLGGGSANREHTREAAMKRAESNLDQAHQQHHDNRLLNDDKYALKAAGGDAALAETLKGEAADREAKREAQQTENAALQNSGLDADDLLKRIEELLADSSSQNTAEMSGLITQLMRTSGPGQYVPAVNKVLERGPSMASRAVARAEEKNILIGNAQRSQIHNGQLRDLGAAYTATATAGLPPSAAGSLNGDQMQFLNEMAQNNQQLQSSLTRYASQVQTSDARNSIGKTQEQHQQWARGVFPTAAAAQQQAQQAAAPQAQAAPQQQQPPSQPPQPPQSNP